LPPQERCDVVFVTTALLVLLILVAVPILYLYTLALAAIRTPRNIVRGQLRTRFAITIAAHNEDAVISQTVQTLLQQDYPRDRFDVHVVADHCTDLTEARARTAGAIVHERSDQPSGSKGAALRWLFARLFGESSEVYGAVVIFDADTLVAPDFLRVMDARLNLGDLVIQGQHRISNPQDGWFAALTWAMFIIDNRFQNLGRSNIGLSAKNMGDSICFRVDVLRRLGWGEGLTEDYEFRQKLLLDGVKIAYEPRAVGYGEAPPNWHTARTQRARWLRGTYDASGRYARPLIVEALRRWDLRLLDGALQARLPSYSSLTAIVVLCIVVQAVAIVAARIPGSAALFGLWSLAALVLFVYPLLGLALERAPLRAYLVIMTGPIFIAWRTWLSLTVRYRDSKVVWLRTPRRAART
jgi:cellulose synthase/poly-beta-1,6-N-acetylglucosamine synthase-like glycosyltransferase